MDKQKRAGLEFRGWKAGTAAEFLELLDEESAYIEIKLALSEKLRENEHEKALHKLS